MIRRLLLALLTACCAFVVHLLVGGGRSAAAETTPSLVPAYVRPAQLEALAASGIAPAVVVVNPASGPGAEPEAAYRDAVAALRAAGHTVLGYVHTRYGARPTAEVAADVRRYADWYDVDGIFLDETSSDEATVRHYRALSDVVRDGTREGFVALNPGVVPAAGYFAFADTVVTFEGAATAFATHRDPAWVTSMPPRKVTHLIYDDAAAPAPAPAAGARLYRTPGVLPNPWGTLPPL